MNSMKVFKLNKSAQLPVRKTPLSVGYDICTNKDAICNPNSVTKIATGLIIIPPKNSYLLLLPRSSFAQNYNLNFNTGVIDPDYTDELLISVSNLNNYPIAIPKFSSIAQLVIHPMKTPKIALLTQRPASTLHKGFGSTDNFQKQTIRIKRPSKQDVVAEKIDEETYTTEEQENTIHELNDILPIENQ